jgi:hypothetical protein
MNPMPAKFHPESEPTKRDRFLSRWRRRGWRGFHALSARLPSSRHNDGLVFETSHGSRFLLNPRAYIDDVILREGYYESEVFEALRPLLRAGEVLWDIGANFGLHAVTAARFAPDVQVVAFEPNPAEHARLLRHRAWNAPAMLTCSLALSDKAGLLPLFWVPTGTPAARRSSPGSKRKRAHA